MLTSRADAWLFAPAALILAVQLLFFPVPVGAAFSGLIIGLLGSLGAVGLALVWRSNRVVNFAQGDLGVFPATLSVLLVTVVGLPWIVGLTAGFATAALVGLLADVLVVRRFQRAPRLQLTVATLGLAQVLGFAALLLPQAWGEGPAIRSLPAPFELTFTVGEVNFDANDLIALVVAPLLIAGLAGFLRLTDTGTAVRAAADRPDRAGGAGYPGPATRGTGLDTRIAAVLRLGLSHRRGHQPAVRRRYRSGDRAACHGRARDRTHDPHGGHRRHGGIARTAGDRHPLEHRGRGTGGADPRRADHRQPADPTTGSHSSRP
ncbi:MAG: branched-chain amino acid ABC transporter permease [Microthrixaceae bacterium]